jgi:hypothetical protein
MMKDQEEMLVMTYGREQYDSLVLGLINGLPWLVKQQVAPWETDFSASMTIRYFYHRKWDGTRWQGGRVVSFFN